MASQTVPRNASADRGSVILGTRTGNNILLTGNDDPAKPEETSGGRIFTSADMPELEGMLKDIFEQLEIVSAVFERPASEIVPKEQQRPERSSGPRVAGHANHAGFGSMVVLGGFPAATLTAGVVMLTGAFVGASAVSNAYVALFLILGGIGLGLTAWAAIRDAHRD